MISDVSSTSISQSTQMVIQMVRVGKRCLLALLCLPWKVSVPEALFYGFTSLRCEKEKKVIKIKPYVIWEVVMPCR
jgi:hypothetical protein